MDSPSENSYEPDEFSLSVLTACQYRGALSAEELAGLLDWPAGQVTSLDALLAAEMLTQQGTKYAVTSAGRRFLDSVLEGIERQLTPEDPAFVRRYRREKPTLPFDANTIWAEAVCINYRVNPQALRPLVPSVFELDLYQGMAFISLTASRLKDFGVGWLPAALRTNFYQATYRAHVTYTDFRGRQMRGCYFVRSDTNHRLMSLTANLLPEFRAHRCSTHPILMVRRGPHWILTVDSSNDPAGKVVLVLDTQVEIDEMPSGSIFPSKTAAYEFLVDFYDAFAYDPAGRDVFILRIDRGDWAIHTLQPVDYYLGYFQHPPFCANNAELDSVFYFTNTPYRWLPLVKERIRHT